MKRMTIILFAALAAFCGCNMFNDLVHDDQVVAKACGEKLYRSELAKYIPGGISPEDSVRLAEKYIRSWASDILFENAAERQLGKAGKDVGKELEEYRRSLLKYRYEQQYISDRLDTAITDRQVLEYYDAHKESFTLPRPILKVRFISIVKDSQNRKEILAKLPSEGGSGKADLDSLAFITALRYIDNSSVWTDAGVLAQEFGTDYETMLTHLKDNYIIFESEERGDLRAAYVFSIIRKGTAPLEFCRPLICDNILSSRKRDLLINLEQELLTEAEKNKDFVTISE